MVTDVQESGYEQNGRIGRAKNEANTQAEDQAGPRRPLLVSRTNWSLCGLGVFARVDPFAPRLRVSRRSAFFVGSCGDDTGEVGSDVRAVMVYWPAVVAGDECSTGGGFVLDGVQGR